MMTKTLYGAIAAVCLSLTVTNVAFGQPCTANLGPISAANSPAGVAGNTCNNNLSQVSICGNGDTLNGSGVDIYTLAVGAGNNFTVTVTSSAFPPTVSLTSTTTCSSNAPCKFDNAPPGTATSPYSVSGSATGLAPGNYFLFISDTGADPTGCGAYNLAISGQLPVELKNFSVD